MQLLVKDPEQRMTLAQLAAHPWTTADGMRPLNLQQTADSVAVRISSKTYGCILPAITPNVSAVEGRHCAVRSAEHFCAWEQRSGDAQTGGLSHEGLWPQDNRHLCPQLAIEHMSVCSAVSSSQACNCMHPI